MSWDITVAEARPGCGEDKIATIVRPDRIIVIVVDGAGGISGGANAAEMLCAEFDVSVEGVRWDAWLMAMDRRMVVSSLCGLAAAVVIEINNDGSIVGASVGDCEAWIFKDGEQEVLTDRQCRKPLLGSGKAVPVAFTARFLGGVLVAGSDGLWKYTSYSRIREAIAARPLKVATDKLVDTVRLRTGSLQDDVAVFIYTSGAK